MERGERRSREGSMGAEAAEVTDGIDGLRPLVVIGLDELQADMRDPAWQDFLRRAAAYRRKLRDRGNLH